MNKGLHKQRIISRIGVSTPLLVPSFSSKGFPNIGDLHDWCKCDLTEISLVSAYDLYFKHISLENIYCSETVIIDSGGYEASDHYDLGESCEFYYSPQKWSLSQYIEVLQEIDPLSNLIIVNFDNFSAKSKSYQEQIEEALELFNLNPKYCSDLLIKPEKNGALLDIEEITKVSGIGQFDIIGFTEKELGLSLFERCRNIARMRIALTSKGLFTPIHIFGALDPWSVSMYYLCGADIFDSLSWLRYAFASNGCSMYMNNHVFTSNGDWEEDEQSLRLKTYIGNMRYLREFSKNLANLAGIDDLQELGFDWATIGAMEQLFAAVMSSL